MTRACLDPPVTFVCSCERQYSGEPDVYACYGDGCDATLLCDACVRRCHDCGKTFCGEHVTYRRGEHVCGDCLAMERETEWAELYARRQHEVIERALGDVFQEWK